MSQCEGLVVVLPLLVTTSTVAREQDDLSSCEVQAGVVSSDLTVLGQHPVLVTSLR